MIETKIYNLIAGDEVIIKPSRYCRVIVVMEYEENDSKDWIRSVEQNSERSL